MNNELYIICVDDEKIVLDSLNSQLTRNFGAKYNYEFAESAEEALEIIDEISSADEEMIVVIISDWLMPGMKGDELLIKAKQKAKCAKTILLTGHVDHELLREIEQNADGIFQTLYKPWSENRLIEMIVD
jgi:DNA-binding NtrC family response regulator